MDALVIEGKSGQAGRLQGAVTVSGAKNAALPVLFATLLSDQDCTLTNVPDLLDISTTLKILEHIGATVEWDHNSRSALVNARSCSSLEAPYELVRTMRASVLVLGPLLARFGKARVSLPGGCTIGARPVNLHLMALEKMGAQIQIDGGYINASCSKLRGCEIQFPTISVGATENIMMAACLAEGTTVLENAAREPEITDLAHFLKLAGADIHGEGTGTITIKGMNHLKPAKHQIIADRIEAGTYLTACALTGGDVFLPGVSASLLSAVIDKLREAGATIEVSQQGIRVRSTGELKGVDILTKEFPGFPTDMQAQFMAAMCTAHHSSIINENIFENRYMHVPELVRLGADITIQGNTAVVRGKGPGGLSGATVMATDLRASASLILAALTAKGSTTVRRIYHLDRGYERMEEKLSQLGARIRRVKESK